MHHTDWISSKFPHLMTTNTNMRVTHWEGSSGANQLIRLGCCERHEGFLSGAPERRDHINHRCCLVQRRWQSVKRSKLL
jgi:hypothetical protein